METPTVADVHWAQIEFHVYGCSPIEGKMLAGYGSTPLAIDFLASRFDIAWQDMIQTSQAGVRKQDRWNIFTVTMVHHGEEEYVGENVLYQACRDLSSHLLQVRGKLLDKGLVPIVIYEHPITLIGQWGEMKPSPD